MLAVSGSLVRTIAGAGHPGRAIVLQSGANSEAASILERPVASRIESAPGMRRAREGRPIASADVLTRIHVFDPSTNKRAEVVVRGVGPGVLSLRPEMKIKAGRHIRTGFHELVVGQNATGRFKGLALGDRVSIRGAPWIIVGIFDSGGDARESELLADSATLLSATERNAFNSVTVLLETPGHFAEFRDALMNDTSLSVQVYREPDYLRRQSEPLREAWTFVAYVASGIMALGAMFGAANTMYSSVSARGTEIATLRALGFGPTAVVTSILLEALVLALAGALLGSLVVWLVLNGDTVTTKSGAGRIVARLSLDAGLVMLGIAWACAISIAGGLWPAIGAATRPVAEALREG